MILSVHHLHISFDYSKNLRKGECYKNSTHSRMTRVKNTENVNLLNVQRNASSNKTEACGLTQEQEARSTNRELHRTDKLAVRGLDLEDPTHD